MPSKISTKKGAMYLAAFLLSASANCSQVRNLGYAGSGGSGSGSGSDPNCSKFNSDGSCCQCNYKYYVDTTTGLCTAVSTQCKTWNYKTGACQTCYDGYSLLNGECIANTGLQTCDLFCQSYSDAGKCIKCFKGYYVDSKSGLCVPIPANCINFDYTKNQCTKCADGYVLNAEYTCDKKVTLPPPNCAKFVNDQCVECNDGYYLTSDYLCAELPSNCKTVDSKGVCTDCKDGYFLTCDKVCVAIPKNCAKVDDKGKCIKCEDDYYLSCDNTCVGLPQNCSQADSKGNCVSCDDGYVLDKYNRCIVDTCAKYGYEDSHKGHWRSEHKSDCKKVCIQCIDGYYLTKCHKCQELPENCDYANKDGECQQCADGYRLVDCKCVKKGK